MNTPAFASSETAETVVVAANVDYKNYKSLENFVLETGKILPARVTGTCGYHQKQLSKAIKRARHMAFLKYVEPKRG